MVLVQFSGFQRSNSSLSQTLVTFDDQLVGFASPTNGSFNFTFDVPLAQPGVHLVKAIDFSSSIQASEIFYVLSPVVPSGKLDISVKVGAIYFPGDTVVAYVIAQTNGVLVVPDGVQVTLIQPNGSSSSLTVSSIGNGVFKAIYLVPRASSLGTYAIVVTGGKSGLHSGVSLAAFVVKQTWLSTNGPRMTSTASLVGGIATVVVAWQKGYFRRKVSRRRLDGRAA